MSELRYVLLPPRGFKSPEMKSLLPKGKGQPTHGPMKPFSVRTAGGPAVRVVGSISPDGPKVVEMTPDEARAFRREQEMRVVPVRKYRTALAPIAPASLKFLRDLFRTHAQTQYKVQVKAAGTDRPLNDVTLIAIVDTLTNAGVRRKTGASGQATLTLPEDKPVLKLYVYPPPGFWGKVVERPNLSGEPVVYLHELDPRYRDFLRTRFNTPRPTGIGKGVKVAVIDTGVDAHPDLKGVTRYNAVSREDAYDLTPSDGHGTHVAGIIAGANHGLAPGVELVSYKVFPHSGPTDNVDISTAIDRAVDDGCDLINLSLGGLRQDDLLSESIGHAFDHGSVCVVAAGNATRRPVSYPAWFKRSVAVSAVGKVGTFPADAVEVRELTGERSESDRNLFFAGFSNHGPEIDVCAPGVGVVSTWLGKGYAVENGTSMACPVVTGVAAALLSADQRVLSMQRAAPRAAAIVRLIHEACESVGLPPTSQGFGCPKPNV